MTAPVRDATQLHALCAREALAAPEKGGREEVYRRQRAEQLRLFEAAQPVATPEPLGVPRPKTPEPATAHERTMAIEACLMAHPGSDIKSVCRLFPGFTATCDCHDCAQILATYRDDERGILFVLRAAVQSSRAVDSGARGPACESAGAHLGAATERVFSK